MPLSSAPRVSSLDSMRSDASSQSFASERQGRMSMKAFGDGSLGYGAMASSPQRFPGQTDPGGPSQLTPQSQSSQQSPGSALLGQMQLTVTGQAPVFPALPVQPTMAPRPGVPPRAPPPGQVAGRVSPSVFGPGNGPPGAYYPPSQS
jgi:hypothetical protein